MNVKIITKVTLRMPCYVGVEYKSKYLNFFMKSNYKEYQ